MRISGLIEKRKKKKNYMVFLCGYGKMLKMCLIGLTKRSLLKELILICVCFFNLLVFKHTTSLRIVVCCVWENKGKQC